MGKGTNTTTSASTTSANPQAAALYQQLLGQAQGVAATPYQAYSGELTAPVNAEQTAGISGVNAAAGEAQPAISQATGIAAGAANPLTAAQIQQYQNPYIQNVVNATNASMADTNGQQMASLQGNQIAQGALGGNATGVAKGVLAGQQALNMANVDSNLYANSYNSGVATAGQQFQQNPLAASNAIANYGVAGQNAALTGAGAQIAGGTLQQQTAQAGDTANYNAYAQQQAYPFQTLQWLAGLGTGVGGALGSSSTGQTTAPAPNQTAQYLGAGIAGAGLLLSDRRAKEDIHHIGKTNDGQPIYRYRYKGSPEWHMGLIAQEVEKDHPEHVHGIDGRKFIDLKGATDDAIRRAAGGGVAGTPWANAPSWVPTIGISGAGLHAGSAPSAANTATPNIDWSKLGNITANANGPFASNPSYGGGNMFTGDEFGGSSSAPLEGLDASDYDAGFARGGVVGIAGYADGGAPDDPFGDDNRAIAYDLLRQGRGITAPDTIPGGEPPPVWNPDQPYRMPDQASVDDWRAGHPLPPDGAPPVAQDDDADPLPPEITRGTSRAPSGVAGPSDSTALGYAGAPITMGPDGRPVTTNPAGAYVAPVSQPSPDSGSGRGLGVGFGLVSPNAQSGLLAAGLGMLASRSPNLGNAIGEGGIAGLTAFGAGQKHDEEVAQAAAKLSKEAQQHAEDLGLKTQTLSETIRHNKAGEENASDKTKYVPTGTVITPDGSHPLLSNQQDGKTIDAVTGKPPRPTDRVITKDDKPPPGYTRTQDGGLAFMKGGPHDPEQIAAETAARTKKGTELDDDTVDAIAHRVAEGDTRAVVGLGRNPAGIAQIQKRVAEIFKEQGLDHEEGAKQILSNIADQAGRMTAERTQAGIASKLAVYGRNVDNAIGVATKASEDVSRTGFVPVNRALNSARTQTGDPKTVALGQALYTLINEYARAIGGGHGTVHDKEEAEAKLNQAYTHPQLVAIMNVMRQEIDMTKKSLPEARQEMHDLYAKPSSGQRPGGVTPSTGTSQPAAVPGKIVIQGGHKYEIQPDGSGKLVQ